MSLSRLPWRDAAGSAAVIALVLSAAWVVRIPAPTRSGVVQTPAVVPLLVLLALALGIAVLVRRYRPSRLAWLALGATAGFLAWFAVVCVVRWRRGDMVGEGVLALRSAVLPLVLLAVIDARWVRRHTVLATLALLQLGIVARQIITGEWVRLRLSTFLGNTVTLTTVLMLLVPVQLLLLTSQRRGWWPRLLRWVAAGNLACAVIVPFLSGSRVVAAATVGTLMLGMALLRRWHDLFAALGAMAVGVVVVGALWVGNPWGAGYGIYRVLPVPPSPTAVASPVVGSSTPPTTRQSSISPVPKTPASTPTILPGTTRSPHTIAPATALATPTNPTITSRGKVSDQLEHEKQAADRGRAALRAKAIAEIRKDPWIGTGHVYFDYSDSVYRGQQTAHNVFLERAGAFGIPGAVLSFLPWALILTRLRHSVLHPLNLAVLTATGALSAVSLVQPTAMVLVVVVTYALVVGALLPPHPQPLDRRARRALPERVEMP